MLAAALVLVLSDRSKARAAALQGTLPLVTLVALLVAALGRRREPAERSAQRSARRTA